MLAPVAPELELSRIIGEVVKARKGATAYDYFNRLIKSHPLRDRMVNILILRGFHKSLTDWRTPEDVEKRRDIAREKRCEKVEYARKHGIKSDEVLGHSAAAAMKVLNDVCQKAAVGERVIEMLDSHFVGGRKLGDCSKSHLEAAIGRERHVATERKRLADFYASLLPLIPAGKTLRDASDRASMVRFCEAFTDDGGS
jgi:hypothetical protein